MPVIVLSRLKPRVFRTRSSVAKMFPGSTSIVSSPNSKLPSAARSASAAAVGFSRSESGSIVFYEALASFSAVTGRSRRKGFGISTRPVEHALFPDEKEAGHHEGHEHQHLQERKHLQILIDNGPGIQKNGFDI